MQLRHTSTYVEQSFRRYASRGKRAAPVLAGVCCVAISLTGQISDRENQCAGINNLTFFLQLLPLQQPAVGCPEACYR